MVCVYLDAENVSEKEAEEAIGKIRETAGNDWIVGKFYGSKEQIGSSLRKYLDLGYEWVDTTDLSTAKKNCADIKICTDVFSDIFAPHSVISKIYVVSKDTDFLPLVRKLQGLGLSVEVPLYREERAKVTLQDVEEGLRKVGWCPKDEGIAILDNQFCRIRGLLDEGYSDELVETYLHRKYLKFLHSALPVAAGFADLINGFDTRTFNFWQLKKYNFSKAEMKVLISLYTSKCFGFSFPKNKVEEVVSEVFA